jgi:LmbE family N-acetylglucosaminyl deacetylase
LKDCFYCEVALKEFMLITPLLKKISKFQKPKLLAVFAHPDDEAFLMGGALALYAQQGIQVELLCLTHGEEGSTGTPALCDRQQLARFREAELKQCCEILGVNLLPLATFPDGQLARLGVWQLAQTITQVIQKRQPDIVVTFGTDGLTGHPDHLIVSQATTLAFKYSAQTGVALFYASLEASTVEKLSDKMEGKLDNLPLRLSGIDQKLLHVTVETTSTAGLKWAALNCHRTQAANFINLTEADRDLLSQSEHFRLVSVMAKDQMSIPAPADLAARLPKSAKGDLFEAVYCYRAMDWHKVESTIMSTLLQTAY